MKKNNLPENKKPLVITTGELAEVHRIVTEHLDAGIHYVNLSAENLDVIRRVFEYHLTGGN